MSKRKLLTKGVVLGLLCAMNLACIEPNNAMASSAPSNTTYEEYTSMDMASAEAFLREDLDQKTTDMILSNLSIAEVKFIQDVETIKEKNKDKSVDEIVNLIDWDNFARTQPKIYGFSSGSLVDEFNNLTPTEKTLVVLYPKEALIVKSCAEETDTWTNKYFRGWKDGDKGNAYRHAFWNARMKLVFNSGANAKIWADAHEAWPDSELDGKSWNGFTAYQHRDMDYHNNEQGRDCIEWYELDPFISNSTVHDRIMAKINNNEMMILVK
ncbi:DUF6973 domain-containing protein [Lachnoclostridium phytofermentans]|uniref:DUF6973 domain-containing protein n=1 Tax=Lachnoclostridium phytofermentans (strain ATCC 700394 / DSM 18823 / ISDg) TaxID=357809 RepID=A9KJC9_LACP7|nr:hypothetical protein [Lachnoclostridium phytofermentans]ABX42541.1 hypothetical protein Cphy_2175 [Lachnoclostridium phytofermentans ISDg]